MESKENPGKIFYGKQGKSGKNILWKARKIREKYFTKHLSGDCETQEFLSTLDMSFLGQNIFSSITYTVYDKSV